MISQATRWTAHALIAAGFAVTMQFLPQAASASDQPRARLAQATQPPPAAGPGNPGIEGRIAQLRKDLNLTAAQRPKFDAFAQAMRQNAHDMTALIEHEKQQAHDNALANLRASARLADAQAAGLKRLVPAFETLYDSLSDAQKHKADQLLASH